MYGVQLQNYNDAFLYVQQSTLLCVITEKRFEENSDFGEDYDQSFAAVVVGEGVTDNAYVGCGRRRNNSQIYMFGSVLDYCSTVVRGSFNLSGIDIA